jgi:hypothetical protein
LALCACVCALLLSTAPFDQLATDSTVPQHLAGYKAQGLLGELELPAEGISRLAARRRPSTGSARTAACPSRNAPRPRPSLKPTRAPRPS